MDDTANQIKNIQEKIERKEFQLRNLTTSLKTDKKTLESLLKLQEKKKEPKPKPKKEFITLDCQHNVGLYNKPCTSPYAKCALHNCLLSYWDIRSRKCVMKMCKHLEDIERVI